MSSQGDITLYKKKNNKYKDIVKGVNMKENSTNTHKLQTNLHAHQCERVCKLQLVLLVKLMHQLAANTSRLIGIGEQGVISP